MNALGMTMLAASLAVAPAVGATDAANRFAAQMRACATIPHHGERLSCYDRAAATEGEAAPDADAAAAQLANFGLLVGAEQRPNARGSEMQSIDSTVRRAVRRADERLYVTLENGQVWLINSRDPLLRPGNTVTIRRAPLGSFTMRVPSGRPVKVRRVS
jgi:hypothetical protein